MKFFKKIWHFYQNKTHRVISRRVVCRDLADHSRLVPQWWLFWWHYYWDAIGVDFYIPLSFENQESADKWLGKYL